MQTLIRFFLMDDGEKKYVQMWWQMLMKAAITIFATQPRWLSGKRVGLSDCEFDTWLRQTFFPAYFCLSPLWNHVRKVVVGFGK